MALAVLALAAAPGGARAQAERAESGQPGGVGQAGGFAGVDLAMEPVLGLLDASAVRVWAWNEPGGTGEPGVQRVVLERDVRLLLGGYDLSADRAAIWITPEPGEPGTVQMAAYLEGVDTPGADAAVAVTAEDLRVTGVIRLQRPIGVAGDRVTPEPPGPADGAARVFLDRADAALDLMLADTRPPRAIEPAPPPDSAPPAPADVADPGPGETDGALPEPREPAAPILQPSGFVTLSADSIVRTTSGEQDAVVLAGGMTATYSIPGRRASETRTLELSAQRAVVFLADRGREGAGLRTSFSAGEIDGIYLEGNVIAADKGYVVRGPRVFYDVANDQALILDAVFIAENAGQGFPLYVRADSVRQLSQAEFVADNARVSNVAFARPNLSLGTSEITIARRASGDAKTQAGGDAPLDSTYIDAKHITLRAGTIPLAYLPRFRGDPERVALRDIRFVTSTDSGEEIRTRWDLFSLLGLEAPDGVGVNLLADALLDRGPAFGLTANWNRGAHSGGLLTYWVFNDTGTDVLSSGARIDRDGETRGIVRGENVTTLDGQWTLFTEVAHVTDAAFTDAFFEGLAEAGRRFDTRARLRKLTDNAVFWIEASTQLDDFTPNEYLLQSQGYAVQRYPEASYTRLADDLIREYPGLLTYSQSSRIGYLRLQLTDATPAEYGLTQNFRAQQALGLNANDNIADSLRAQGIDETPRFRFDTRHEFSAQLAAGPVQVTPFVVGRLTAYDDDFSQFGPGTGNAGRWWGAAGLTLATTVQRVYDGVFSRALDLDRLRHILRPSFTVFHAESTVEQEELPVFDEEVESLAEGTIYRFSLEQTLQTKRGGPGRRYSVDVLTFDTEFVFTGRDLDPESSIGRYDPSRPELSRLTDFMTLTGSWQATDSLSLVGGIIYDLREGQRSTTTAGIVLQNAPQLSTFLRYRHLHEIDSTLLSTGAEFQMGEKYSVSSEVTYDTDEADVQSVRVELLRDFQSAVFGTNIGYNNDSNSTSLGVVFQPLGRGTVSRAGFGAERGTGRSDAPLGG